MGTPWSEKSLNSQRRVVEKLVKGRDSATQLRLLLQKPPSTGNHGSILSAQETVLKILKSFDECLSELNSCDLSGEFCQIPASTRMGSPNCGDQLSVDSGESTKMLPVKDRRGGYKRRKTDVDSWIEVSPSMDDGFAWRKYGQKEILNSKFPRCYFRCTHKHDLGCTATKQVQRIQTEEPKITYQTTYFGHHTCRDALQRDNSKIINISEFDDDDHVESYLSFESKNIQSDQNHHHRPYCPSRAPPSSMEEETKEEEQSVGASDDNVIVSPSPLDSIVLPDLIPLESIGRSILSADDLHHVGHAIPAVNYSSSGGSSSGSHGLADMDSLLIKSVDFESYFCFDDSEAHYL